MKRLTTTVLQKENERFAGTGGRSEVNRDLGFRPAFFDCATCAIYLSRYRDGRVAPLHLLDGLPDEVVLVRAQCGRVVVVKSSLISGFERNGFFYTRAAAAKAVAQWSTPLPEVWTDTAEGE
jgi:hypothetical protein